MSHTPKDRGSGILLPVSSLGGFGPAAYRFVNFLKAAGQKYWQVLPLNPRDGCNSPYNSPNSLTIDPAYGSLAAWAKLKKYAHRQGIKIIGDLPFFVAWGSKEYQANQRYFLKGQLSGVPPDNFSPRGQLWGHPQYNWETLEKDGFNSFLDRLGYALKLFDIVRLDHFRGYHAVWSIPVGRRTAAAGRWVEVPGEKLFKMVRAKYPGKILIAEDLGHMTTQVDKLRRRFGFLATRVLIFHPRRIIKNCILYTSVHDSDTVVGTTKKEGSHWKYMARGMKSQAAIFIAPMQDVLGLGSKARFNRPGTKRGNWRWRLEMSLLTPDLAEKLKTLTKETGRC